MTSIEQALYTVIALIILIGIVYLFFSVFGSTECDKLSNTTAIELTNAINKVALEQDVSPWTENSAPPDEKTEYYTIVPIRLCEKNRMNTVSALFSAQSPTYILAYETFPESGYAWSESQPFSGGATESLLNYVGFKYGLKLATYATKYTVKFAKALWDGSVSLVKLKILRWFEASRIKRWLDNNKYYTAVRDFLKRHFSSAVQTTVQDTLEDKLNKKYYPSKFKSLVDDIKGFVKSGLFSEEEALIKAGVIEGVQDPDTGKWIANKLYDLNTGNGQYIVKQEYRQFMQLFIENTGEASEMYKGLYHIPSKLGSWFEKQKLKRWYPLKYSVKNWWQNTWFKKSIDRIRGFYDDKIKGTWNDWMNHKEVLTTYDTPQEIGAIKDYAMMHRDELLQEVKDNPTDFMAQINDINARLGIEKVITKADDIADEDAIRLINNYERYYNANILTLYFPREQGELVDKGAKFFGKEYYDRAENLRETVFNSKSTLAEISAAWQDYNILSTPAKNLDPVVKQALISKISQGYSKEIDEQVFDDVYEYARVSAFKNGAFSTNNLNLLVSEADKVKADMVVAPLYLSKRLYITEPLKVTDRFLTPILTEQSFSKLKTLTTYGWKRLKRGVFIDMNRVGLDTWPITVAPYNWISSPYSIKQALAEASAVKEGGCSNNAICRIVRMGAQGPTETSNSYLLDRRIPESISVKTWRQKPSVLERTPIGINTISFYLSVPENPRFYVVSPCFGLAKVWKNGDTVFVDIEKDKKCNVNCSQPGLTVGTPSLFGGVIPSVQYTFGVSDKDTPNYCYADEQYVWGVNDEPYWYAYAGEYGTCIGLCMAVTYASGGASLKTCLKACGYVTIGTLAVNTLAATQAYRDVPSWERQETGWGYWNYQKAMDICDSIDLISSFGSFSTTKVVGGKVVPVVGEGQKILSTSGLKIQKIASKTTMGVGDICTAIQVIGDTSLAWPIKTPMPEVWKKAGVLDEKCMQDSASKCAWLRRCDPPAVPCPEDPQTHQPMNCVNGECKKTG